MVNGCLVYGVELNDNDLDHIIEWLSEKFPDEMIEIKGRINEARKGEYHFTEVFDDLNEKLYEAFDCKDVFLFMNGACCQISEKFPYFLGWKSFSSSDGGCGSFEIEMPSKSSLRIIRNHIYEVSDARPSFYIMSDDCSSCS